MSVSAKKWESEQRVRWERILVFHIKNEDEAEANPCIEEKTTI